MAAARAGVKRWLLLALMAGVLSVGWLYWRQGQRTVEAERKVALDAARVIDVQFKDAGALIVRRAEGRITANSNEPGFLGIFPKSQTAVIPFTANYTVDLRQVGPDKYRWDAKTKTMLVELPEVAVEPPNVDMARAQVTQSGIVVGSGPTLRMNQAIASGAKARAVDETGKPANLEAARASARRQVAAMVGAPLKAAGLSDVQVAVRFPIDGQRSGERWDESTPLSALYPDTR